MTRPILYDYPRSSAAYRVRIALNLKRVDYQQRVISLIDGQQRSAEYLALNPQGLVPMLEIDGHRLTQSLAIIDYLDRRYADDQLYPALADARAHVMAMAMTVACDIHPLNNLRVLGYLKRELGHAQEAVDAWYAHWILKGFAALETLAARQAGEFLFGNKATAADVFLIPQIYNARRFKVPLDAFPTLLRAEENANRMEAFAAAHPDRQEMPK